MTYLQTHNRPYQNRNRAIGALIVSFFLIVIVLQIFVPHFFGSFFTSLAKPFWRTEFSINSGSLNSNSALLNKNEELKRQLVELQLRLDTIKSIEIENAELKNLLNRESSPTTFIDSSTSTNISSILASSKNNIEEKENKVLAAVFKRPPFLPYDELIIDIGRDHGISTSSLVYAVGNVLIGKITDVLVSTSKVRLFSSPGEKYEVLIGSQNYPANAIGRGGGQYEAQISRDALVKEGDFVINSSLNNRPFGIISSILSDPTQPFETILFAPLVNIYQIRWVLIENRNE